MAATYTHQDDRVLLPGLRVESLDAQGESPSDQAQQAHLCQALNHHEEGGEEDQGVPLDAVQRFFDIVVVVQQEDDDGARNCDPDGCVAQQHGSTARINTKGVTVTRQRVWRGSARCTHDQCG